jgi:exonuclease III
MEKKFATDKPAKIKTPKQFTILHQNMDRLANKVERLIHLLQDIKPDLLVLTEHGLKPSEIENTHILEYTLVAHFSRTNYKKGGVAIYKNDNVRFTVEPAGTSDFSIEMQCELITVKVKQGHKDMHIVGIYRTQGNLDTSLDVISRTLEETPTWKSPVILVGDINMTVWNKTVN